jgi:hypothetical protein
MDIVSMEDQFLNDTWNLYFHDPDNSNWDMDSYQLLATISSVHDWIKVFASFQDVWNKGMFFLMREYIQPIWEDEHNKQGGCISFKIWKNEVADYWFELSGKVLGEKIFKEGHQLEWQKISGISISPKRSYCIARIWLYNETIKDTNLYNIQLPNYSKVMYKSHTENKDYEV